MECSIWEGRQRGDRSRKAGSKKQRPGGLAPVESRNQQGQERGRSRSQEAPSQVNGVQLYGYGYCHPLLPSFLPLE